MVEIVRHSPSSEGHVDQGGLPVRFRICPAWARTIPSVRSVALAATLLAGLACGLTFSVGASSARLPGPRSDAAIVNKSEQAVTTRPVATSTTVVSPVATTTPTTVETTPVTALPVAAVTPAVTPAVAPAVAPTASEPSVAAMVAEVEASGIEPGSNWSWSVGDTSTHCGAMTGAGTGCTYGSGGLEYSVFSGSPTLALVAHELANAETQNDAVPSLLNEVAAAAAGSSWSPTDAVASCLVAHFMGMQDQSAGSWQCPAALAATVAANIHDSV
jgi:hypothetical protein